MQIAVLRAEPPFQLQRQVFSVYIKDDVGLYPVVDQLHLDVPHVRAHLLDFLRRWVRAIGNALRAPRSEEHTSELQSRPHLVCRLLLEKKKNTTYRMIQ